MLCYFTSLLFNFISDFWFLSFFFFLNLNSYFRENVYKINLMRLNSMVIFKGIEIGPKLIIKKIFSNFLKQHT